MVLCSGTLLFCTLVLCTLVLCTLLLCRVRFYCARYASICGLYAAIVYGTMLLCTVRCYCVRYATAMYCTLLVCMLLLCARKEEEVNEFVSAVCWKQNSNVIVAANSQGTIKVSKPETSWVMSSE